MDNSPLWLNTVSGPSGEKGANSAHRVYLTDRPGFGVQPGGNSQWKPQLIIIFTGCKIFPCQIISKKKGSLLEHHTFSRILRGGGGGNKTQPDSKEMNIQMHSSFFFFFPLYLHKKISSENYHLCEELVKLPSKANWIFFWWAHHNVYLSSSVPSWSISIAALHHLCQQPRLEYYNAQREPYNVFV